MKVITEAILRDELRREQPEAYYIPDGKILSPAAREYLQQRKIKISKEPGPQTGNAAAEAASKSFSDPSFTRGAQSDSQMFQPAQAGSKMPQTDTQETSQGREAGLRYIDQQSGAYYVKKPEHMTQLHGNVLVPKDHPHIVFRGKLDSLQSLIVLDQVEIAAEGREKLAEELEDILSLLREMMRTDALELPFERDMIIGFTHEELHDRSHNPMKFYQIQPMLLPHYKMGLAYARLNQLRSAVRETETAAAAAFRSGMRVTRPDLLEGLNRLSSAVHVMMCRYLAGEYEPDVRRT